jgi:hypothetical protein
MNRKDILDFASNAVTKDRAATHGEMESNFHCIAEFWSIYLGYRVDATQVGMMLALVNVARQKSNPGHESNYVDLARYAACSGELEDRGPEVPLTPEVEDIAYQIDAFDEDDLFDDGPSTLGKGKPKTPGFGAGGEVAGSRTPTPLMDRGEVIVPTPRKLPVKPHAAVHPVKRAYMSPRDDDTHDTDDDYAL